MTDRTTQQQAGRIAQYKGFPRNANPYCHGSDAFRRWDAGWRGAAMAERANKAIVVKLKREAEKT